MLDGPLAAYFSPEEAAEIERRLPDLPPAQQQRAMDILRELARREGQQVLARMYPDETQRISGETYYARRLYPRHMEFFAAGATHRERAMVAANRVGKTYGVGGYETALHLTGRYPEWWEGRRFAKPVDAWAAGDTTETTRDIIQLTLFGEVGGDGPRKRPTGTGLIPGDAIGEVSWRRGVADMIDTARIRHASGGWSRIGLKSYDQKRRSFQGTAKHLIWLDEECPEDVYDECLTRTATTRGLMMLTFTPLSGLTTLVQGFVNPAIAA